MNVPDQLEEQLSRWRGAGLLTPSQAEAIRAYEGLRGEQGTPAPPAEQEISAPPAGEVGGEAGRPDVAEPAAATQAQPQAAPPPVALPVALPVAPPRPDLTRSAPAFLRPALDARTLGAILAALALLAVIGAVFALATDLVVAPAHRWATDVEDLLHAAAAGVGLTGGLWMAGGRRDGRRLVLASLGVNLAATIVFSAQHLLEWTTLGPVLVWVLLAWLTWNARFRAAAVATRSHLS